MGTDGVGSVRSADGTVIAFERSGWGDPLVLIHGSSAERGRWRGVLPLLESHFTVYAVDRRGRGASTDGDDYAFDREVDDVGAVLDSLSEPVTLLGHSYGGICSLEAAVRAGNLRRLILYEPPIPTGAQIYEPGMIDRLQALHYAGDREALVATFVTEVVRASPGQLELMRSLPSWDARVLAAHTLVREVRAHEAYVFHPERLATFDTPTLLLLGGESPPFFTAATDALEEALPRSTRRLLPGQQHAAMDTVPRLFVEEILRFTAQT